MKLFGHLKKNVISKKTSNFCQKMDKIGMSFFFLQIFSQTIGFKEKKVDRTFVAETVFIQRTKVRLRDYHKSGRFLFRGDLKFFTKSKTIKGLTFKQMKTTPALCI